MTAPHPPVALGDPPPVLAARGIVKGYPLPRGERLPVLEGVALAVAKGEVVALLGAGLGLLACWALARFRFIDIPSDVYFLSSLPVRVEPADVLLVVVLTFALCLLAAGYPAWWASRRSPVESLRKA